MLVITRGAGLTAVVDPVRGAKIVSLLDHDGREWLAQADPEAVPGAAFADAEMAGWDECAPSIVACEVDGRDIPDHGDLWDSLFEIDGSTARGRGDGYAFERRIDPSPVGLRLSYRVLADRPMPFLWAAHPQFAAPAGTRVQLPRSVDVVLDVLHPEPIPRAWGAKLGTLDTLEPGGYRKYYVDPNHPVFSASLVRPDGATLDLSWSRECPYLGVWLDNASFSREPVIALEPSTGFYDSLDTAVRANRVTRLEAGVPLEWWVELSVR
jgi:hypothetical protein